MRGRRSVATWGWRVSPAHVADGRLGAGGLFETLRSYRGRVFALDAHVERLVASAKTLGMALPASPRAIAEALRRMGRAFPSTDAVLRATVIAGTGRRSRPQLVVMGRALRPYPRHWYTRGVDIATAVHSRFSTATIPPQAKHADLVPGVLAHGECSSRAVEILYRTSDGLVAEGTVSNLCIVTREPALLSPAPSGGALAGITCEMIFALAGQLGLRAAWQPLTRHDVWSAAEAFVTNTTFEVLPVVRYDGRVIGAGRPGPWTRRLHAAFRAHVKEHAR